MPIVSVPEPYRGPTAGLGEVPVEGTTVRECLDAVETKFPGFAPLIYDADGELQKFVKLFLNGDLLERGKALDRSVGPDDEVGVLAAISGG